MGMPKIDISFSARAATVKARAGQGIVAMILFDAEASVQGMHTINSVNDIPAALSADNKAYITRCFTGYVNRPAKVLAYVLDDGETAYADALDVLGTYDFDWIVGDPAATAALATELKVWVIAQRSNYDRPYKAVLPDTAADDEAIVNYTTTSVSVGSSTFTAAQFCSRIAGILAGTPATMSGSYAPVPEATTCTRLTKAAMDTAVDAGKLIVFHDGTKVKLGRAVTSLVTLGTKSALLKKIKIVTAMDIIERDLRVLCQDHYIGHYANSYDNKCVLVQAIKSYFAQLESEGIIEAGQSIVEIDVSAQRTYLISQGVDVSGMSDQQVKEYNTGDEVFISADIRMLDAIEDITIAIQF